MRVGSNSSRIGGLTRMELDLSVPYTPKKGHLSTRSDGGYSVEK